MCVPLLRCADWTIVNQISALDPLTLLAQAEDDAVLFLGEDFLPWMVLALGAAMVVGNIAALTRPPDPQDGAAPRPPVARATVMIVVGLVAAIWGLASLVSG